MTHASHLRVLPADSHPRPDPLGEARAAGNGHIDAGLDALNVALTHFADAERYAELLSPGVMQLLRGWALTIPNGVLAVTAIRDRSAR